MMEHLIQDYYSSYFTECEFIDNLSNTFDDFEGHLKELYRADARLVMIWRRSHVMVLEISMDNQSHEISKPIPCFWFTECLYDFSKYTFLPT